MDAHVRTVTVTAIVAETGPRPVLSGEVPEASTGFLGTTRPKHEISDGQTRQ